MKVVCDDCGSRELIPDQGSVEANAVLIERELGWVAVKGEQFCCFCQQFHVEAGGTIWWAYFTREDSACEMKIQLEAHNRLDADVFARRIARRMDYDWHLTDLKACR